MRRVRVVAESSVVFERHGGRGGGRLGRAGIARDARRAARVEQRDHRVDELRPHSGEAARHGVDAQSEGQTRHLDRQGLTHAGRMREQQVALQFPEPVGLDADV
ncbi:MAG TPA: hypothetical protein PLV92_21690, partial [Pirellulaceae bacterium]|nr:hypothetical protein [Pirellulaceae bacterium]